MIQISQLKLPVLHAEEELKRKIGKMLHIDSDVILSYTIKKRSLDARKKPDIFYVYTVWVAVDNESALKRKIKNEQIVFDKHSEPYECHITGTIVLRHKPVVVGSGPAGLFCGYQLAVMGYEPIILEQGATIEERLEDVEKFWETGILNPFSNVQFGEGGAGTFSDGKLNTLVKDPQKRGKKVLETFVEFGAPEEILYDNKPHIGTDILMTVVKNMRNAIMKLGGEIRFHTRVIDLLLRTTDDVRAIEGIQVEDTRTKQTSTIDTNIVVIAIGHSARETFQRLQDLHVPMEAKSFAVGVRIEHPQDMVDDAQYGGGLHKKLPAAAYKLTAKTNDERGVYTFCMCPGGYVVNASSEKECIAVNGMSYHDRSGANANSAVIVTVSPEDFDADNPLSGIEFQRKLERKAYEQGRGAVPIQLYGDFKENRVSGEIRGITPQIKGTYRLSNVRSIFPEYVSQALEEGITAFGKKLKGFDCPDAVISGVESRTSSPVRILRGDNLESDIQGLYPCGEGAGYAGGITSAAMDGLKVAEEIAKLYQPFDKVRSRLRNF